MEILKIHYDKFYYVLASDLKNYLEKEEELKYWINKEKSKYSFTSEYDFIEEESDYKLTIPMARDLCIIENNEKGKNGAKLLLEHLLSNSLHDSIKTYSLDRRKIMFEQYKLFQGSAEKISDRRAAANTFFLTINTGLITASGIGNLVKTEADNKIFLLFIAIISFSAIFMCITWYRLLSSYSSLNSAKFKIINKIEESLPLRPFFTEWQILSEGKFDKLHKPFNKIEKNIPLIYGILHILIILISSINFL